MDQFKSVINTSSPYAPLPLGDIFPSPFHRNVQEVGYLGLGIDWAHIVELWYAFPFALCFILLRTLSKYYIFPPLATACGAKKKNIDKFSYQMWLFLFYGISSVYGWCLLSSKDWVAWPVGPRESMNFFIHHPHQPDHDMRIYYSYEAGFFLGELIAIFLEKRRSDFLQYLIHHIVTLVLIVMSWGGYDHRIGSYILLLHDISDVLLCLAKIMHYLQIEWMVNIWFILFVASFGFLRLYCLPVVVYVLTHLAPVVRFANLNFWVLVALLGVVLQGLHVFWFCLILRMVIRLISGTKGDVRSDDDDDNNDNNNINNNNKNSSSKAKQRPSGRARSRKED